MDKHKSQHGVVNIRPDLLGARDGRLPIGGSDAIDNRCVQFVDCWFSVRLEQAVVNLTEDVANSIGFLSQLDGK